MAMTTTDVAVTVKVLLFASYAERLGRETLELHLEPGATVARALELLRALPGGGHLPPRPLCAVNLAHVSPETRLAAGDELAILPPLAGG